MRDYITDDDQIVTWLRTACDELSATKDELTDDHRDAVNGPEAARELSSLVRMVENLEHAFLRPLPPMGRPQQEYQQPKLTHDLIEAINLRAEDLSLLRSDINAFDPSVRLSPGAESIVKRLGQRDTGLEERARVASAKLALLRNRLQVPSE